MGNDYSMDGRDGRDGDDDYDSSDEHKNYVSFKPGRRTESDENQDYSTGIEGNNLCVTLLSLKGFVSKYGVKVARQENNLVVESNGGPQYSVLGEVDNLKHLLTHFSCLNDVDPVSWKAQNSDHARLTWHAFFTDPFFTLIWSKSMLNKDKPLRVLADDVNNLNGVGVNATLPQREHLLTMRLLERIHEVLYLRFALTCPKPKGLPSLSKAQQDLLTSLITPVAVLTDL